MGKKLPPQYFTSKIKKIMSNTILHKANTRGNANHGWLDAHHSLSFTNHY
ncbi:MAG: hypothetical protein U5L45_26335 [Saprospiraceae bacterium]|nr:hypothetical protein [Saprospiraceae bacterium]